MGFRTHTLKPEAKSIGYAPPSVLADGESNGCGVTHRQLLQEVWGPGNEDETHYLRVHFAHIRAKVEPDPANPRAVITEPGIGYRLRAE